MSSKTLAKRLQKIEQQAKPSGVVVVRLITDEHCQVISGACGKPETVLLVRDQGESLADFETRLTELLRRSQGITEVIFYGYGEMH